MLEVKEMEETEQAKAEKKTTPILDKRTKVLRADPRSASEGVDRTPIAVERQNDLDTPVLLSYSPLLPKLKTLALDPRSPCGLERTPIVVEEERPSRGSEKDLLRRVLNVNDSPSSSSTPIRSSLASSSSLESSLTTSTPVMSTVNSDRGQPRKLLQNQFRGNLEALYDKNDISKETAEEPVGGGTETEDLVFIEPNSLEDLVSDVPPILAMGTPPAAGDFAPVAQI